MIRDRVIVCFASSWYIDPTSKHHVMRLLSEHNDVIWVNYHASRRPRISRGDLGSVLQKLREIRRGPDRITERLQVITPLVLPLPGFPGVASLNRFLLVRRIRRALREFEGRRVQLWTFAPDTGFMAGRLGEEALVYYCVDEFSEFDGYDAALVRRQEAELIARADLVITTSRALQESKAPLHSRVHLVPHGVEFGHFARALDESIPVPREVAQLPRPILGFFGLIQEWVDVELIGLLARAHPEWSVLLIGEARADVSRLLAMPNIHLIGRRPYAELPAFAREFDVALIPFRINELTRNVNPIKLREYLAAGCAVVSTPLPEVSHYADRIEIAEGEEFVRACERALSSDSPAARRARSEAVRDEGWPRKVERISGLVCDALEERERSTC